MFLKKLKVLYFWILGYKVTRRPNKPRYKDHPFHFRKNKKRIKKFLNYKQKNKCYYCRKEFSDNPLSRMTIEHMNPYAVSKDNSLRNLCLSCFECNAVKKEIPFHTFKTLMKGFNLSKDRVSDFIFDKIFSMQDIIEAEKIFLKSDFYNHSCSFFRINPNRNDSFKNFYYNRLIKNSIKHKNAELIERENNNARISRSS